MNYDFYTLALIGFWFLLSISFAAFFSVRFYNYFLKESSYPLWKKVVLEIIFVLFILSVGSFAIWMLLFLIVDLV